LQTEKERIDFEQITACIWTKHSSRQPFPSCGPKTSCKVWRAVLIFHQQFRSHCCCEILGFMEF